MRSVISVKNLTKRYKNLTAVDNLSFEVFKGEIFGLLGENGAGKTTTLEIIEGLRRPTSGKVEMLGKDTAKEVNAIKAKIGVQLQSSAYYEFLTLKEILELFGGFYPSSISSEELLRLVKLEEKANSYVTKLSGGQKQRFSIIASLVNNPEIVFLDEPTTGLDPLARRNLWEIIKKIKSQGKTIILTTHYMEEAELLCDRVAIMDRGKIIAIDKTHRLVEQSATPFKISFISSKPRNLLNKLTKYGELKTLNGSNHFILYTESLENNYKALDAVRELSPESLTVAKASLEDVFIEKTGRAITEQER